MKQKGFICLEPQKWRRNVIDRVLVRILFCTVLLGLPLTGTGAHAEELANNQTDLIAFFKQAISSPPDVDQFISKQVTLRDQISSRAETRIFPPLWYEGARSSSNFYLRVIPDPLATNSEKSTFGVNMVAGQYGGNSFNLNKNALAWTEEQGSNNPVYSFSKSQHALLNQFLNMGLGDVVPQSVTWNGNSFKAQLDNGKPICGILEISNNLPAKLKVDICGDGQPYKILSYSYPTPAESLSRFPSKIQVVELSDNGFQPSIEISLAQIRLASGQIPETEFAEANFINSNIAYTNTFKNGAYYVHHGNGMVQQVTYSAGTNQSQAHVKIMIFMFLGGSTLAFGLFVIKHRKPYK